MGGGGRVTHPIYYMDEQAYGGGGVGGWLVVGGWHSEFITWMSKHMVGVGGRAVVVVGG